MFGLTLDTGAVIAIADALTSKRGTEATRRRIVHVWEQAVATPRAVTVPALVLAEFWRGQQAGPVVKLVAALTVEPVDTAMAKAIGLYLAEHGTRAGPSIVDASVVLSAARRGDDIYTSDLSDIRKVVSDLQLEKRVRVRSLDG